MLEPLAVGPRGYPRHQREREINLHNMLGPLAVGPQGDHRHQVAVARVTSEVGLKKFFKVEYNLSFSLVYQSEKKKF